jgi:hypothetical protein
MVTGTSDFAKKFHPILLTFTTNETSKAYEFTFRSLKKGVYEVLGYNINPKYLLADGARAITNGFEAAFGNDYTRLMCYFHVLYNLKKHKAAFQATYNDLKAMHLCINLEEFHFLSKLFISKWNHVYPEFVQCIKNSWVYSVLKNWFVGAGQLGIPCTNNSLEATNLQIKNKFMKRIRKPIAEFLPILSQMLESWSKDRNFGMRNSWVFAPLTDQLSLQTSAHQWYLIYIKNSFLGRLVSSTSVEEVIIFCTEPRAVDNLDVSKFLSLKVYSDLARCEGRLFLGTLDNYKKIKDSYTVITHMIYTQKIVCFCEYFFKNYTCCHALGFSFFKGSI